MTCIVAVTDGNTVWVGGDSAGVAGYRLTVRADEKVFQRYDKKRNSWVFGFTSSFRMGQLIRYALDLPIPPDRDEELDKFMAIDFVNALRKCFEEGGWLFKEHERESGGTFIVGLRGKIFVIQGDYQVGKPSHDFDTVGCGDDIARGSLYATADMQDAEQRVLKALEAAEEFSGGVRAPFNIVRT